jgi:hypothetical protein
MTETKARLYTTAVATIACALFKRGDHVAVEYSHKDGEGTLWFNVSPDSCQMKRWTVYPEHHLTNFVL